MRAATGRGFCSGARAVFAEYGSEAQMDDVARRAGVGVGTVYRHYPTKEALLVELVREKFRLFAAEAREALERDGEPFEVLADLMRSMPKRWSAMPAPNRCSRAPASTSGPMPQPSRTSCWS